jgi:hypothetical protein
MKKMVGLKLAMKVLVLIIFGVLLAGGFPGNSSSAMPPSCPNEEELTNCQQPGTQYVPDWENCVCICPQYSGLCAQPGNPQGEIDPATCMCRGCIDLLACGG